MGISAFRHLRRSMRGARRGGAALTISAAPARGTSVHMAMVWDLTHYAIDDELAFAVLRAGDKRKCFDHEGAFFWGRLRAMIAQHRHRRIARIAIENGKAEGLGETRVPGSIFFQFAQIALGHMHHCLA